MNCSLSSLLALVCAATVSFSAPGLRAAPGDVDLTFNPNANSYINSTVSQADGKIIVGGAFTTLQPNGAVSATTRNYIARLNTDGSLDTTFNPNANSNVSCFAVQADGKIIVGGAFTSLQPNGATTATTRNRLARLNTDGGLDIFNPNANGNVLGLAVQTDGKIIVGGAFTTLQPNGVASATTRNYIARLNTDGSLDTTFNPNANGSVNSVVMQADGKILIAGIFTTLQPNGAVSATTRNYIARLNTDGSLDTTFNPNANSYVQCMAVQADGKVVIGGAFTSLQPNGAANSTARNYIARLSSNGSLDTAFYPRTSNSLSSLAVQTDGKIILGGIFSSLASTGATSYTARNGLARLNTDGILDTTFTTDANDYVYSILEQTDGKILVGGLFGYLQIIGSSNTVPRNYLTRLANDAAVQKILVTGQSGTTGTVQLLRSGALPETQLVTFETSTDAGATWTNLTTASRITGGWQVSGYNLGGTTGLIRARLRNNGGRYDGSSGLLEVVAPFPTPDISVEQPANTALVSNFSTVDYGTLPLSQTTSRTFVVRNGGPGVLSLSSVTVDGVNAGDFIVGTSMTDANVASGSSTTFTVAFAPVSTTASGYRSATLHVASNANGTSAPFNITLNTLGLSTTVSTSSDGLNDYAKYQLAALGFDWQQYQPALVQTLYGGANSAGLYTTAQVQALNVGTPLIQRDASTGQFKLTIAVKQSADLQTFTPLSLSTGSTTINSAGALEFRFNGPSGARFFRLQSQ